MVQVLKHRYHITVDELPRVEPTMSPVHHGMYIPIPVLTIYASPIIRFMSFLLNVLQKNGNLLLNIYTYFYIRLGEITMLHLKQ